MGQHGPHCICEICTCGRHQCPFDRSKTNTALSFGNDGEGHFYRKEFARVENGGERARPTQPKDELALNNAPFSVGRDDNELRLALASGGDARNERFVTSAALRKRTQNSQIELGNFTIGGPSTGMRSTYREESERALQNGTERIRATRPMAFTQLFQNQVETPKTTIHQSEFGAKQSERIHPTRPKTSDLWKRDGTVEGTTTTREQFAEKRPSERSRPFRPKENAAILGDGDRAFQRETSNLSEFGPKRVERLEGRRPFNSDLFKSGEPLLERATVNRSEYGQGGRGERFERMVRPNEGSELLRGDGTFLGEASKNAEFKPKRGDRFEAKVQGSSDIWKSGERLEGHGVNREEYGREGKGDRFPPHRPTESGILKGEGSFERETHKRVEFGPKQGQRTEAARPRTSDIWKQSQCQPMANGQSTVTRSEYRGGRGERFEMKKPADSNILRSQGKFDAESVARSEFGQKGVGERFITRRPKTNELWRKEGRMAEDGSVNRVVYTIEEKQGERHEMRRPKDVPLFDLDIDPSQPPLSTVHRTEFVQRQGERATRNVPTDEGAELLRGDGTFLGETSKNAEFQPKKGDRFEAKVQGSSDIWKTEGRMDGKTVNRNEYRHTKGEKAEQRRPEESGILRGEGSFASDTHKRVEFAPKRGERVEAIRPIDSELFMREGKIGMEGSINSTEYSHTQGERAERRIQKDSGILLPADGSEFAKSTVNRDHYNEKKGEYVKAHRPTESWHLEGPQADYSTVSREDYVGKILDNDGNYPARGRTNESSFGLLEDGENAEFGRTMTQDEFGLKELGERPHPIVHLSELSLTEPGATFHSSTMYSDNFQQISPDSYGTRTKIRPSTSLKLSGERELSSGYQMEYTNKIMPCPAGELIDSLKNHHNCEEAALKEHPHTDNFEFHSISKGHHLYRSKENLAED